MMTIKILTKRKFSMACQYSSWYQCIIFMRNLEKLNKKKKRFVFILICLFTEYDWSRNFEICLNHIFRRVNVFYFISNITQRKCVPKKWFYFPYNILHEVILDWNWKNAKYHKWCYMFHSDFFFSKMYWIEYIKN